jgi:hypothetical protein
MVSDVDLSLPTDLPLPPKRGNTTRMNDGESYQNVQMDLFQTFLCNTDAERDRMSNTIDIWDSIPRYSVSRQEMNKRRDSNGNLPLLNISFEYRGQPYTAEIQPALLKEGDKTVAYYPSASEELVEDALRKLATHQNRGFFEKPTFRSGVAFSLYELRAELTARGHTRSFQEIVQSLTILRKSHIELWVGEGRGESFIAANYLPALAAVSKKKLLDDPGARWVAQFHPLITQCIDQLTYRQFNYAMMMALPSQLARWIHRQLSIKFTFAGLAANPFEIRYSTIKRDSCLLNCAREIDNRRCVDDALADLVQVKALQEVTKEPVRANRGKIVDVIYQLKPTKEFVKEMKAANKRLQGALKVR